MADNPNTDITELDATSTGQWLVTTRGSRHIWDLDAHTWTRLPGPGRGQFSHDSTPVVYTRVERWPRVGGTTFLWFDDPEAPHLVEQWRQSSTVATIEALSAHQLHELLDGR